MEKFRFYANIVLYLGGDSKESIHLLGHAMSIIYGRIIFFEGFYALVLGIIAGT